VVDEAIEEVLKCDLCVSQTPVEREEHKEEAIREALITLEEAGVPPEV
jgi:hypothetical protein